MASTVLKLSKHASLTCVSLSKIIIHAPNVKTKASLNVDQEKAKVYQICWSKVKSTVHFDALLNPMVGYYYILCSPQSCD